MASTPHAVLTTVRLRRSPGESRFGIVLDSGSPGLTVSGLEEGGPAARCGGLHARDVIVTVNGIDVASLTAQVALLVLHHVTGEVVDLEVARPTGDVHRRQDGYLVGGGTSTGEEIMMKGTETIGKETAASGKNGIELAKRETTEKESTGNGTIGGQSTKGGSNGIDSAGTTGSDVKSVEHDKHSAGGVCPLASTPNYSPHATKATTLRYLQDETANCEDILHLKADTPHMGCTGGVCSGSVMSPPDQRPPGTTRPKTEVIRQAEDFFDQYYTSINMLNSPDHVTRWRQVLSSIEATGVYDMTLDELTFGAKTAWRNAPRCIGRIQWSKLKVFDARRVKSAREMFDILCEHMEFATNNGLIRSAITIFPPRTDGRTDFKIWSTQLIRYAGYRHEDGTVTGDPASVEYTELCIKMGWIRPLTPGPFDVLPLILQAGGGDPELFTIPPHLILEVPFSHPKYPALEELGLRWYALPAVANMLLDCGGLEFTGCPFNGWYMSSEIATRDLCDEYRYNMLKSVADVLGFDTKSNVTLWKDKAMTELNVAVLHSFQKQRVTITDHHSAAESFMKHMRKEVRVRGGCPADWVWVVPPISGSLTPVFHQEMLNYKLKPSYEYQDPAPWRTHKWQRPLETATDTKMSPKLKFRQLINAVRLSTSLMHRAMERRVKCTILYATETGRAHTFSKQLADLFQHCFDTKVVCMEDYDVTDLQHESLVLVVTSTFGNGDPPENGMELAKAIHQMSPLDKNPLTYKSLFSPRSSSTPQPAPDTDRRTRIKFRFAVFGLGSSAYPHYCAFGLFMDAMLEAVGGERLTAMGHGDEQHGQEDDFNEWSHQVYKKCKDLKFPKTGNKREKRPSEDKPTATNVKNSTPQSAPEDVAPELPAETSDVATEAMSGHNVVDTSDNSSLESSLDSSASWYELLHANYLLLKEESCSEFNMEQSVADKGTAADLLSRGRHSWAADRVRLVAAPGPHSTNLQHNLSKVHKKQIFVCKLKSREQLQSAESDRQTILCRLALPDAADQSRYEVGDHVGVYPANRKALVDAVLAKTVVDGGLGPDTAVSPERAVEDQSVISATKKKWVRDERLPVTTLRHALTYLLDLTSPPTQNFIKHLTKMASSNEDREKLELLANDAVFYDDWRFEHVPDMGDVARLFPSLALPASFLLTQLPLLQHRFYSISSCPALYPGQVHATVAVVAFTTHGGEQREGLCSSWLNTIDVDAEVPCFIRKAPHFHLPQDQSPPIILVGPGTGVAPFRAFWQQRMVDLKSMGPQAKSGEEGSGYGPMSLFFGCRREAVDWIYRTETGEMSAAGVLSDVHLALSREPDKKKTYVQDSLLAAGGSVHRALVEQGGHVFVCGDVAMASNVCETLERILVREGGMTTDEARHYVMTMREKDRFHEDIFGVTLKTSEVKQSVRQQVKLGWKRIVDVTRFLPPQNKERGRSSSLQYDPDPDQKSTENNEPRWPPLSMMLRRFSVSLPVEKSKLARLTDTIRPSVGTLNV